MRLVTVLSLYPFIFDMQYDVHVTSFWNFLRSESCALMFYQEVGLRKSPPSSK